MACLKFTYHGDSFPSYSTLCEVCGEDVWAHQNAFRDHTQKKMQKINCYGELAEYLGRDVDIVREYCKIARIVNFFY